MAKYWVYAFGHADLRPPLEWLVEWSHHRTEMWFPDSKRPVSISRGDRAVMYGSQGRGFLAAVEITGDGPEENTDPDGRDRYPWVFKHRLLVSKVADDNIATPESAGISTRRVQRGPHTEISREEYERGVAVLLEAARRTAC